jgi:hypothetical protein
MISTETVTVDRVEARALYRKYREHQHYSTPIDHEIQRTYQLIAQGRVVIKALASIAAAGLGADGLPKLAIIRADATHCFVWLHRDGSARFSMSQRSCDRHTRTFVETPAGSFTPEPPSRWGGNAHRAQVPLVPVHLRPKRGLANYHILFEAEWSPVPPKDPLLLRRIGQADLWIVLAAWDLTEIERAVLAGRITA